MPLALVVEDDKEIRTLFVEALQTSGFAVLEAHNVSEAIARLNDNQPDIAFIDINMPGQTGVDLLRHMKSVARLSRVKTIVVTANAMTENKVEELGVDLFLLKPVSIVEMLTLARRLLKT